MAALIKHALGGIDTQARPCLKGFAPHIVIQNMTPRANFEHGKNQFLIKIQCLKGNKGGIHLTA